MDTPSPVMRGLARRLLALEAAGQPAADAHAHEAVRVCEKLRVSLTRVAGPDGFASLLRRTLAVSRAEVPAISAITIKPDGSIEGLGALSRGEGAEAAVAITANLLGLLVTFIGEPLTLGLVRDAWPGASFDPEQD